MRHPFDGIITLDETNKSTNDNVENSLLQNHSRNRRSFFQLIAAGLTGCIGLVLGSKASLSRADQMDAAAANRRGRLTTQALGEEGGRVTTQAIGEEGGRPRPPRPRPHPTTYALGEEGAGGSNSRRQLRKPR